MRSFHEFVTEKVDLDFDEKLFSLLFPVAEGLVPFDEFVEKVIFSTFTERMQSINESITEQELLNEFLNKFKQFWKNSAMPQTPSDPIVDQFASARYQQMLDKNKQGAGYKNPKQMVNVEKLNHINKSVKTLINQELIPVINRISDTIKAQAYNTNNKQLYQAAELFAQRLIKFTQSINFSASNKPMGADVKQRFNQYNNQVIGDLTRQVQNWQPAKAG